MPSAKQKKMPFWGKWLVCSVSFAGFVGLIVYGPTSVMIPAVIVLSGVAVGAYLAALWTHLID